MRTKRNHLLILSAMLAVCVCLLGCGSGGGGMGGQGFNITINQYGGDEPATQSATANGDAGETRGNTSGTNASNICITNTDGGTLTGNPSVAPAMETTTSQNKPETPQGP